MIKGNALFLELVQVTLGKRNGLPHSPSEEKWCLFSEEFQKQSLTAFLLPGQLTREETLKQMEQPPLTEEEGKQMFKDIAKKLQITEDELQSYFDKGYDGHKYRTSNWAYKIGIKIYQTLGLGHRIRK